MDIIGPFHITSYSSGVVSMAGDFNILTINVRGTIKDFEKRNKLLACAQLNNINVILMQETHVCGLNYKKKLTKYLTVNHIGLLGQVIQKVLPYYYLIILKEKFLNLIGTLKVALLLLK